MKRFVVLLITLMFVAAGYTQSVAAEKLGGSVTDLKVTGDNSGAKLVWCKPKGVIGTLKYEIYKKVKKSDFVSADAVPANKLAVFGSDGGCLEYYDSSVKKGKTYGYGIMVEDEYGNRSDVSVGKEVGDTVTKIK